MAGGHDCIFACAQIGNRRLAEETEDDREAFLWQLLLKYGIADDGGSGFETALPSRLGGIADEQAFGRKTCSNKHGLADALEFGPTRGDTDKIGGMGGHVALQVRLQFRRDGMNLKGGELIASRQQLPNGGGLAGQHGGAWNPRACSAWRILREPQPTTGRDKACSISLITMRRSSGSGSITSQRAGGSSASQRRRRALISASEAPSLRALGGQFANHLVDGHLRGQGASGRVVRTKTPLPWRVLDPALAFKLAVGRAGRVGVDAEAARKIARAGQPLARRQFVAKNAEHHLRDQLLTEGNIAGAIEPEPHAFSFNLPVAP